MTSLICREEWLAPGAAAGVRWDCAAAVGAAQDRFNGLLKQEWGPVLRDLGFKGSGRAWTLPDDEYWVRLGFQTSMASTAEMSRFTMNLLVVGKEAWTAAREGAPYLQLTPPPNYRCGFARHSQRAGFLAHGHDYWWRLAGDGSNERSIADEITDLLRTTIVPRLRGEAVDQNPDLRH